MDGGTIIGRASRPRELQDSLNLYFYHPLAWHLARLLARTPITPNMVSIVGGLFVMAAAVAYALPGWPWPPLLGLLLHMSWHVIDGADGDLARMTGRTGPVGELVDGICDYASHIVLYVVLAYLLHAQIGPAAWALAAGAGASHIVQSNHFEVQRRQYQWWVYGVPWLRNAHDAGFARTGGLAALSSAYLALAGRLSPDTPGIDAAIAEAASNPVSMQQIRGDIRAELTELMPRLNIFNNSQRTMVLGAAMLAGSPIYYFLYEIFILNVAFMHSLKIQRAAADRIHRRIGEVHSEPYDKQRDSQLRTPAS